MGYEIAHYDYDENIDKKEVESNLNLNACIRGAEEGVSGLYNPITWHDDLVFESRGKAWEYIDSIDTNSRKQIAVKYKELIPNEHESDTLIQKKKELSKLIKEWLELDDNHYFKKHDAPDKIECSKCGSTINKDYIKMNRCPACSSDLRPKAFIEKVNNLRERSKILGGEVDNMIKQESANYEIKWLVKVEYRV